MPERAPHGADPLQRKPRPLEQGLAEDYAALEATLRGTPLGRWFLAEYMRRNRTPETQLLLDAIGQAGSGRAQAAAADGLRHRAGRAHRDERGDRPHAARDCPAPSAPAVRQATQRRDGGARPDRRGDREGHLGHPVSRGRHPGGCLDAAGEGDRASSSATGSISAPSTSTPPARSRTSPGSGPARWCGRCI